MIVNGSYQFARKTERNSAEGSSYILMPPKGDGLFKSLVPGGRKGEIESNGGEVKDELSLVGGYLASMPEQQAQKLEKQGWRVIPDTVEQYLPDIPGDELKPAADDDDGEDPKPEPPPEPFKERAPLEKARFSDPLVDKFTGEGVTVAVIDTGIYPHPDFTTPNNRVVAFVDLVEGRSVPYDDNGHGTHVAGDAAGSGLMSDGLYKGLASHSNLVGVKVLGADGSGKTSDIIKGLEWCIKHKDDLNLRVINLSVGHKAHKDAGEDPVDQAVKAAHDAGIVVVAAAGNDGPDRKSVTAPGDSPFAITVGAVDDKNTADRGDDTITDFSGRGPTPGGLQKPDVVAPGEGIYAPLAPGTEKESNSEHNQLLHQSLKFWSEQGHDVLMQVPKEQFQLMGLAGTTIAKLRESDESAQKEFVRLLKATSRTPMSDDGAYIALPGTSMATPIVTGLVAQMLEANPDLTPDQVKSILVDTADKLPGKVGKNTQGAGMIDPHNALLKALATKGERGAAPPPEEAKPAQPGNDTPGPTPPQA